MKVQVVVERLETGEFEVGFASTEETEPSDEAWNAYVDTIIEPYLADCYLKYNTGKTREEEDGDLQFAWVIVKPECRNTMLKMTRDVFK
jgi:hypothetical protein